MCELNDMRRKKKGDWPSNTRRIAWASRPLLLWRETRGARAVVSAAAFVYAARLPIRIRLIAFGLRRIAG